MHNRPSCATARPAQTYAAPNERIMEFSHANGGGLIGIRAVEGAVLVDVYRTDPTVRILAGNATTLLPGNGRAEPAALRTESGALVFVYERDGRLHVSVDLDEWTGEDPAPVTVAVQDATVFTTGG